MKFGNAKVVAQDGKFAGVVVLVAALMVAGQSDGRIHTAAGTGQAAATTAPVKAAEWPAEGEAMTKPGEPSEAGGETVESVAGADTSVLAADVFMRFQEIKLAGDGCDSNYRFLLYDDGRLFMQENSSEDCASRPTDSRFNKPFQELPTKTLDHASMAAIKKALADTGFAEMVSSYSPVGKIFDGSVKIMEVRSAGQGLKRVISIKSASRPLETLLEVVWAQLY